MFGFLTVRAQEILQKTYGVRDIEIAWLSPRESMRGDASTSIALSLAKKLGKNPQEIAQALAEKLSGLSEVEHAEVAGAGYVNVYLKPAALLQELLSSREAQAKKLTEQKKKEQKIVIDYSHPNIAKPLGVHHLLSTIVGQAIANINRNAGFTVVGVNHIGDWGTQFGKLAIAFDRWGTKPIDQYSLDELLALYVKFHEEAEKDSTLEDAAREAFRNLEQGQKDLRAFWQTVVNITMQSMQRPYERLHVSFDLIQGESFYEDKMAPILEEGKKKKLFTVGKEGALIVEFPEETNLPPAIVLKADGSTIYFTRDLATARYRIDTWHPIEILYVVDVAQQQYFQQLFATLKLLKWELPVMEHVIFGRMSFVDRQMSTRKGNILKLEEVLDEAVTRAGKVIAEHRESIQTDDETALAEMMGVGAVAYGILSQNRKMDMVFDWEKFLSFEGNSAPYLQYTHARACSVLRKADATERRAFPDDIAVLAETERLLLKTLLLFPSVLDDARETRMPHKLANYLFQLCQDFNAFYNKEPILKAEEEQRNFRLTLTQEMAEVLRTGAELLTLRLPDRM